MSVRVVPVADAPGLDPRARSGEADALPADGDTAAIDAQALDAYSRTVAGVVDRLAPSVANLRVLRATRRGRVPAGAGSARCSPSRRIRTGWMCHAR